MDTSMTQSAQRHWTLRRIAMGLVLAAVVAGIAAPAQADDRHRRDDHRRGRDYHHDRGYEAPVYAPPGVIYAPSPGPPALQFVFPLTFR